MGFGFAAAPPFFVFFASLVTIAVVLIFGFVIFKGISTWMSNNASPVLTARAKVIGKRSRVSGGGQDTAVSTRYFITFELESGDRIELPVNGNQFGVLVENDRGSLTWQGTRFKGFERAR